jgi:phage protein D
MPIPIRSTLPQLYVKVNGQALPKEAFDAILEGVIESSLHLPDACTLRIHDHEFKWLDSTYWEEGKEVTIEAGQGRDPLIKIFDGEVTTLEVDLAAMGVATLTVRCMDKGHRLHRGKKRKTFVNVKDSDIVNQLAGENGLRGMIDSTTTVHDWVIQNNQTDWEFLQFLAQRNGHRVYVQEKNSLCFKKIDDAPDEIPLEWGKALRSFRIRVNSSSQVNKVIVRSWDPKTKRSIVGQAAKAQGGPTIGMRSEGGATAQRAFGSAEMVVVDRPVRSVEEATKMAQSVCDDIGASFIEADGLCYNVPQLSPGDKVALSNIGKRFNGKYIVTSTTHTFSAAEGFSTQFVISGKEPATLMSVLGGGGGGGGKTPSKGSPNAGSIVIGLVTDNMDPENQGRVKVKFPALSDDLTTDWIRIATPMAGPDRGFMFLPEIGDEVLVAFENGDVHQGYIIGCLWNGKDKPPMPNNLAVKSGAVRHRRIKTRYGHILDFDDEEKRVVLQTPKGHRLVINDEDSVISLKTAKGFEFHSDDMVGQILVHTPAGAALTLNDTQMFAHLQDQAGNYVELNPGGISINAISLVNLKATAGVNISGAMVNINTAPAATKKSDPTKDSQKNREVDNK